MRHIRTIAIAGLALTVGVAACSNFLDSPSAVSDPNAPTEASLGQLLVGAEANVFGEQEGGLAMLVCEWMQQCSGIGGRFVEQQANYSIGTFGGSWASVYGGGGLVQIRAAEKLADDKGDAKYKGVLEVIEAMNVIWAADIWGDVPYSEAVTDVATPKLDSQQSVYAAMLALLDQAITDLGGAGSGPGATDLIYNGDPSKWIQAAHTLKARIHLHQVEKLGTGEYAAALTEANAGISTPANDWNTVHSTATTERNVWAQFQLSSFGNDLVAGSTLVDLMVAQNDPRLPDYFGKNSQGGYGGYDISTGATDPATISPIAGSGRTNDPTFSQPIITYDENQLIIAEAELNAGNVGAAATALNNVRARYSKSAIAAPTLQDIIDEKYIALFQNVEAWNDYKRTCYPTMTPAAGAARIPGRIYYSDAERQTNPNIPAIDQQNLSTVRNWNDPNACT